MEDSTCDVCMYSFASGLNFCGNFFGGNVFLRIVEKKTQKPAEISASYM